MALSSIGFRQCNLDYSVFVKRGGWGTIILSVYVDDVVLTGDDQTGILQLKKHFSKSFEIKDLGTLKHFSKSFEIKDLDNLKHFLGIEVSKSRKGICLSQRKYALDLLRSTGNLGAKPADTPIKMSHKLSFEDGDLLEDAQMYRRLVGKLIYLTITQPDISHAVNMVSQYMHATRASHLKTYTVVY